MGLGGNPEVSLHCEDVLLIEIVVGLACERVKTASWSPSICHRVRSGLPKGQSA